MSDSRRGDNRGIRPETYTAQALGHVEPVTRALVPPLHLSSTYERDVDGGYSSGRAYSRPHNPAYDDPEALLTRLEGGHESLLLASGMAAATAVFQALLPGDHVVAPRVMYWALRKWLTDFAMPWGLDVEFVDTGDPQALAAAMRPGQTRIVWIETPANPTWSVTDIAASARIAHDAGARLAVDATVATPVLTRPIELGADLVVHSATKYLNGHSDVIAGAIVGAREDALWQRIRAWRRDGGGVLGPFEAWLLLRGMRTLFLRVRRACESAMAVARHFDGHPALREVLYPGLPQHPGHAIAAAQMDGGFGGMLSLRVAGGEAAAMAVAGAVTVFKRATSLGGVESLIEHRASIEGPTTPVPGDLLRLSIGLEDADDLIADLEQALAQAPRASETPAPAVAAALPPPTPEEALATLVETRAAPLVRERGGDVGLESYEGGVARLWYAGSPGASLAIEADLCRLVEHYLPEVTSVVLVARGAGDPVAAIRDDPVARLQSVLDTHVNPAVASHGGRVVVVAVRDSGRGATASLRLEGGCQGCALADVTLRQGVEPLLRREVPELRGVVDVTDHAAGPDPYFRTRKA